MKYTLIVITLLILTSSCSNSSKLSGGTYGSPAMEHPLLDPNTFKIEKYSTDKSYGYTEKNPIMVGGTGGGPANERRFLNALEGPDGEIIEYFRSGSCCPFKTDNSAWGGMLDKYVIKYEGLEKEIVLYLNMYDADTLKVPVGFGLWYD